MPLLMLKDLPRYECLLKAAEKYPGLEPMACHAFFHLLRTGDAVYAAEGGFLATHHVSQGRFNVLMLLNRCERQMSTPAELAEEAGVTRATMTGLIDTLEKDGLVGREDHPENRRTIRVRLTKAGRAYLKKLTPKYFRRVSEMIEPLNELERKQLVRLLEKVQRGLNRKLGGSIAIKA